MRTVLLAAEVAVDAETVQQTDENTGITRPIVIGQRATITLRGYDFDTDRVYRLAFGASTDKPMPELMSYVIVDPTDADRKYIAALDDVPPVTIDGEAYDMEPVE